MLNDGGREEEINHHGGGWIHCNGSASVVFYFSFKHCWDGLKVWFGHIDDGFVQWLIWSFYLNKIRSR